MIADLSSTSICSLYLGGIALALGGTAYYFYGQGESPESQGRNVGTAIKGAKAVAEAQAGLKRGQEEYQKVYVSFP